MIPPHDEVDLEYRTDSIPSVEQRQNGPASIYAKVCSAALMIVAFFQAVCGDGLSALEFWFALFSAAAMQPADNKLADRDRDETRGRLIM